MQLGVSWTLQKFFGIYLVSMQDPISSKFALIDQLPELEPLYGTFKEYLEIPQRVELLNTRVEVLSDVSILA